MKPLERSEILSLEEYDTARPEQRVGVLAAKRVRSVRIGAYLAILFENRTTVRYQIHEMIRIERLRREPEILHELETYNELLGGEGELGCTLLIGIDDPPLRDVLLRRWLGLNENLYLRLASGEKVRGRWDARQVGDDRLSSVQFLIFDVGGEVPVAVGCDHPDPLVNLEVELVDAQRDALRADLVDEELESDGTEWLPAPEIPAPEEGAPAPGFVLRDASGSNLNLLDLRGEPVTLVFFPGAFAPGVSEGLAVLAEASVDGGKLLGIARDSTWTMAAFREATQLPFDFLSDEGGAVARAYRASHDGWLLVQLDPAGRVERRREFASPTADALREALGRR